MSHESIATDDFGRRVRAVLEDEYGYPGPAAEVTARDLLHFSAPRHADLDEAVRRWVADRGDLMSVRSGAYDALDLARRGMAYPAALVLIDWHRCDPEAAERTLACRM